MADRAANRTIWYALFVLVVVALAVAGYIGYEIYPRFDLPASSGVGLFVLAAAAGVAAFFSPCSFGLLVTLLGREGGTAEQGQPSVRRALRFALALAAGASVFLLMSGAVIALGGSALFAGVTFTSVAGRIIRTVVGVLLILLGLVQLGRVPFASFGDIRGRMTPLLRKQARLRRERPTLGYGLFGFSYLLAGFG
ncbi:MAG: cytochrome c biogenesis protein CcdA [Thermomicrobiales bacterium]